MKKSNVKKSTSTKTSSSKPENTSIKKSVGTSIVKSSSDKTKNILETKEKSTVTLSKTSCATNKSTTHETKKKCDTKKTMAEFTFKVNNKTSYFGEKLYVCGNIKELGNWDVKNAFALNTDENLYPSWKGTITLPIDTYIEFKFVSVGTDGTTENVIWEDGENRAATVTKDSDKYESNWNQAIK